MPFTNEKPRDNDWDSGLWRLMGGVPVKLRRDTRTPSAILEGSSAAHDNPNRPPQNLEIQQWRVVLDVIQVVLGV